MKFGGRVSLHSTGERFVSVSRIEEDRETGPDMPEADGKVETHEIGQQRLNDG